jgi:hypothetical protein
MTGFLFIILASSTTASGAGETPRVARMGINNEIRTGDIVALVLAFIGTVIFGACLTVALVRQLSKEPLPEVENSAEEVDDDSIIKKDVSGKLDLHSGNHGRALRNEALIGFICATLVTCCLIYFFSNFEDD